MFGFPDITQHSSLGGLNADDHKQYLLIDGTREMTGTLRPKSIIPIDDFAPGGGYSDLGTKTERFRQLFAIQSLILSGNTSAGSLLKQSPLEGGLMVVNFGGGDGTEIAQLNGGNYPAIAMLGNVYAGSGSIAAVRCTGGGAVNFASSFTQFPSAYAQAESNGYSSFLSGYSFGARGDTRLRSVGNGAFCHGYVTCNILGGASSVESNGGGSVALGRARQTTDLGTARIISTGPGAFSAGYINSSNAGDNEIEALGRGSFAQGSVRTQAGGASIGRILATGVGSFAQGYTNILPLGAPTSIQAIGLGSFAQGFARSGFLDIIAAASNSQQFGPGTNSAADTMQIGSAGLRFKGTTGAPGTPQNGDHWVASGYVYIQSNGVAVKIV